MPQFFTPQQVTEYRGGGVAKRAPIRILLGQDSPNLRWGSWWDDTEIR